MYFPLAPLTLSELKIVDELHERNVVRAPGRGVECTGGLTIFKVLPTLFVDAGQ